MREIVTVGMGNFGVLNAVHWCNGTSKYDASHNTVYMEQANRENVPRVLFFDTSFPTRIVRDDIPLMGGASEWTDAEVLEQAERSEKEKNKTGNDEEKDDATREERDREGDESEKKKKKEKDDEPGEFDIETMPLFQSESSAQAWWKYVTVPLCSRSFCALRPLTSVVEGGDSLLHSFGFGQDTQVQSLGLEAFSDNIRWMLERCDTPQGLQFFVDGDSCFGGMLASILANLTDDFGTSICTASFTTYPHVQFSEKEDDFATQRREEQMLNRGLCTELLGRQSRMFLPFEGSQIHSGVAGCESDVAAAALISAVADTVTYPCRTNTSSDFASFHEIAGTLRPAPSEHIVSSYFSDLAMPPHPHRSEEKEEMSLWSAFEANPLLGKSYKALTHKHAAQFTFEQDPGRVVGHTLTLRGHGKLKDVRYPRQEAIIRYVAPLRTDRFVSRIFSEPFPIAPTFPVSILPKVEDAAHDTVTSWALASHAVNTYSAAPYLGEMCQQFAKVVRYHRHLHQRTYPTYEVDQWKEVLEGLEVARDTYDHSEPE